MLLSTTIHFTFKLEKLDVFGKLIKHQKFSGKLLFDESDSLLKDQILYIYRHKSNLFKNND